MSPPVKGTSRADALCIGGMGEGGGWSLQLYPGTAVSARAGCGGGVALLVPPPTPNACRLHTSAAIYATLDQRRVSRLQRCTGGTRGRSSGQTRLLQTRDSRC